MLIPKVPVASYSNAPPFTQISDQCRLFDVPPASIGSNFRPVQTFRRSSGLDRVEFPTSAAFSALSSVRCCQDHLEAAPAIRLSGDHGSAVPAHDSQLIASSRPSPRVRLLGFLRSTSGGMPQTGVPQELRDQR
jgi:hypothetical protein